MNKMIINNIIAYEFNEIIYLYIANLTFWNEIDGYPCGIGHFSTETWIDQSAPV